MNPYEETSKDNFPGDDIVSENSGYTTSSTDDLFDIIEPAAQNDPSEENPDIMLDAGFDNDQADTEVITDAGYYPEQTEESGLIDETVDTVYQDGIDDAGYAEQDDEDDYSEADEEDDYPESEDESLMIITKGTMITGSIGTDGALLVLGTVTGDISCEGKLTISGKVTGNSFATDVFVNSQRVEGNISCSGTLKVSQGTVIIGDIFAGAAAIGGAVKGNLDINGPVILDSTAVIKGNIKAKSVQLINGAVLEGFCSLEYSDSQIDEIFN